MSEQYNSAWTGTQIDEAISDVRNKVPVFGGAIQTLTDDQKAQARANIGLGNLSLGIASDGLIYLFVDGEPVGTGIPQGTSGDVIGTLDENNNILLTGALADGTYTLKYEYEDGTVAEVGSIIISSIITYSITTSLSNCTASGDTAINSGSSATITVTASSGYTLPDSITVSGASYTWDSSTGIIALSNPTGDVTITVVATEIVVPTYTNLFDPSAATINYRYNSSGTLVAADGYVAVNIDGIGDYIPFTADTKIYIKGAATFQGTGNARIFTYKTSGTDTTNPYSYISYTSMTIEDEGNGVESISGVASSFSSGIVRMAICPKISDSAITADDIANIVITIDEPIG